MDYINDLTGTVELPPMTEGYVGTLGNANRYMKFLCDAMVLFKHNRFCAPRPKSLINNRELFDQIQNAITPYVEFRKMIPGGPFFNIRRVNDGTGEEDSVNNKLFPHLYYHAHTYDFNIPNIHGSEDDRKGHRATKTHKLRHYRVYSVHNCADPFPGWMDDLKFFQNQNEINSFIVKADPFKPNCWSGAWWLRDDAVQSGMPLKIKDIPITIKLNKESEKAAADINNAIRALSQMGAQIELNIANDYHEQVEFQRRHGQVIVDEPIQRLLETCRMIRNGSHLREQYTFTNESLMDAIRQARLSLASNVIDGNKDMPKEIPLGANTATFAQLVCHSC